MSRLSTGSALLDTALGGGLPSGVCEVYGEPASGKTSLLLSTAREALRSGRDAVMIYTDGYPDKPFWLKACRGDLLVSLPTTTENAFNVAYQSIINGARFVGIDSITNLESSSNYGKPIYESSQRANVLAMIDGIERLRDGLRKRDGVVVLSTQVRVPLQSPFKKPCSSFDRYTRTRCDVRIETSREGYRTQYDEFVFLRVGLQVTRSLVSVPMQKTNAFVFSYGIDSGFELMRLLLANGTLVRAGSTIKDPEGNLLGRSYREVAATINRMRSEGTWKYELQFRRIAR